MVTPLALNLNLCYNVSWVQRMRLISCAVTDGKYWFRARNLLKENPDSSI